LTQFSGLPPRNNYSLRRKLCPLLFRFLPLQMTAFRGRRTLFAPSAGRFHAGPAIRWRQNLFRKVFLATELETEFSVFFEVLLSSSNLTAHFSFLPFSSPWMSSPNRFSQANSLIFFERVCQAAFPAPAIGLSFLRVVGRPFPTSGDLCTFSLPPESGNLPSAYVSLLRYTSLGFSRIAFLVPQPCF